MSEHTNESEESAELPSSSVRPRRRWLQISLRRLLLLIALVAVAALAASWYEAPFRRQREAMAAIERAGGSYQAVPAGPAWLRRLFGEDAFRNVTLVNVADCDEPAAYIDHIAALPALETLVVGGLAFADEHLRQLHGVTTLSGLVLDCTEVTDEGIAAICGALPKLEIYRSQRRAIDAARRLGGEAAARARLQVQMDTGHPRLQKLLGAAWFQEAKGSVGFLGGRHRLSDADLPLLSKLTGIHILWISGGQITDDGIRHLAPLTQLGQLHLASLNVTDAGLAALGGLTHLHTLELEDTRIGDETLARIAGLRNLDRLDLSGTRVTDAGLAHLKTTQQLENLKLNRTKVSDAGLAHLNGLSRLWVLELNDTEVTDAGMKHVRRLAKLQTLWLRNTQVGDDGLAELEDLMLSNLHLGRRVTDAGLRHLAHRTSLRYLDLTSTQITDKGVEYLASFTRLKDLNGVNLPTRVSPTAVQALRRAFPKCNVQQY